MYLLLNIDDFLTEIWGVNYKGDVYEKISEVTGRSKRQASEYMRKKDFPAGSYFKIKSWLSSQGMTLLEDDLPIGSEKAVGWLSFLSAIQRHSPELIPITSQKLCDFAEEDLAFLRSLNGLGKDERFVKYKDYLIQRVIPEYCVDAQTASACLVDKNDFDEIRSVIGRIFVEGLLSILSHAEAEYLLLYCTSQDSILSKCISGGDSSVESPSVVFFKLWLDALMLNRKEFIGEMLDHFGESEVVEKNDDSDCLEGLSKDAVEKQIQRYLNEGKPPSWRMVEKWSQGLYWRAVEIQGRTEGHLGYSQLTMDFYGGVRVLDKIYSEGRKAMPDEINDLMTSYPIRYKAHLKALRGGADT